MARKLGDSNTDWTNWRRSLSREAELAQRKFRVLESPPTPRYCLLVDDDEQVGPSVQTFGSFEAMSAAYRELPSTCFAIPFYGHVFTPVRTEGNAKQRYLLHPSGVLANAGVSRVRVVEDFYTGEGPADLRIVDDAVQRTLLDKPSKSSNTTHDSPEGLWSDAEDDEFANSIDGEADPFSEEDADELDDES